MVERIDCGVFIRAVRNRPKGRASAGSQHKDVEDRFRVGTLIVVDALKL
jgi:hypothetical protein